MLTGTRIAGVTRATAGKYSYFNSLIQQSTADWRGFAPEKHRTKVASGSAEGGLAGRYANALFELAQDHKAIDAVSADLASLRRALETSPDLAHLVRSPVFSA